MRNLPHAFCRTISSNGVPANYNIVKKQLCQSVFLTRTTIAFRNDFHQIRFLRTDERTAVPKLNIKPKIQHELPTNDSIQRALDSDILIASNLIQQRADAGQPVSTKVYSKLFKSLGKSYKLSKIEHFFDQMISHRVDRDLVVYHKILEAVEYSLPDPEINSQVFHFLSNLYNALKNDSHIVPQVSTFCLFVNCAMLSENKDFSIFLLEEMAKLNLTHDKSMCNLLIKLNEKNPEIVFRIWDEMREKKYVPNSRSYGIIVGHFLQKNEYGNALKHFFNMKNDKVVPDFETYNGVLSAMADTPAFHKHFLSTFHDMIRQGLQPDDTTFNALMKYYHFQGNVEKLKELWDKMEKKSVSPTSATCFYLIDLLAQRGDIIAASLYYDKMKRQEVPPTLAIMVSLARMIIKSGNLKLLESFKSEVGQYFSWQVVEEKVLNT